MTEIAQKLSPQNLHLDLMRAATFNEFNGPAVVDSLLAHRELWDAVVMWRASYSFEHSEGISLIVLRDLEQGVNNVDTVYLLTDEDRVNELELLVRRSWYADEVDVMAHEDALRALGSGGPSYASVRVLRVWWD